MSRTAYTFLSGAMALALLLTALLLSGPPPAPAAGPSPSEAAWKPLQVGGARNNDTNGTNGSEPGNTPRTLCAGGDDYGTVQDAVDASEPGDTVVIQNGTYHETVRVWVRDITLKGEDPDGVIIDGGGGSSYCVKVTAPGVTVSNFSVAHTRGGLSFGGGLYIAEDALGAVITGMRSFGNGVNGFQLDAPGTQLRNSTAWENEHGGVLVNATGCLVADCAFWDGIIGIRIHSRDNHIIRNEIHNFEANGIHVGDTGNLVEYNDLYIIPDARKMEPIYVYEPEGSTIRHNREFYVADPDGDGEEPYVEDGSFLRSPFMLFAFFLLGVLGFYLLLVRPLWRKGKEKRLLAEAERKRVLAAERERDRAERARSGRSGGKRRKKVKTRGPKGKRANKRKRD